MRGEPRPFTVGPLLELLRVGDRRAGERLGLGDGEKARQRVQHMKRRGLTAHRADELAVHLGCHPVEVWPDWFACPTR